MTHMPTLAEELSEQLREEPEKKKCPPGVKVAIAAIAGIVVGGGSSYFLLTPTDPWEESVHEGVGKIYARDAQCDVHKAAKEGNIRMLMRWSLNKEELNHQDKDGNTPLHIAALHAQPDAVQLLLNAGADTKIKNKGGKTAEELAASRAVKFAFNYAKKVRETELKVYEDLEKGNGGALSDALRRGLNPNAAPPSGKNTDLLCSACKKSSPDIIRKLLKAGFVIVEPQGKPTALSAALMHDRADLIPLLINSGCCPFHNNFGNEAFLIHDAIYFNKMKAFSALLPYFNVMHYSPLSWAVGTPMFLAVERGNIRAYDQMRERGVDPNNPICSGKTPLLIVAARMNREEMVRRLLKDGVDKNARDKDGKRAIDYAKGKIAELLRD